VLCSDHKTTHRDVKLEARSYEASYMKGRRALEVTLSHGVSGPGH
jgi:hypothetical protein